MVHTLETVFILFLYLHFFIFYFYPYCIFLEAASLRVMIVKKRVYFDEKNTTFNSTQFLLSENSDNWLIKLKVIHLSMSSIIFIGNSFYLWKVLLWDRKLRKTDFSLIQYNAHTKLFEKDVSENHRKILISKCITFNVIKPKGHIRPGFHIVALHFLNFKEVPKRVEQFLNSTSRIRFGNVYLQFPRR